MARAHGVVWVLLQRHVGLAAGVEPVGRAHAGAAAWRAPVVRLAHAVAQRPLTPVVGVQRLLHVVRPEDRRHRADLLDPLAVVDRAGALPRRQAALLEQADRVLAEATA